MRRATVFGSVLVANRGEIARRVLRTLRRLGITSVAVYSDADRDQPHVREADRSVRIGPAAASASYLDIEAIIDAAVRTGADAIHPGYGFLAENAPFAEACEAKGLTFIGPAPETIRLMGDKAASKAHLRAAGVPVIPGATPEEVEADPAGAAEQVGYPLMVKAIAGGGGKGMRTVAAPSDLHDALAAAGREAKAAFGDPRVLLERLVNRPRHVEVQVVGDTRGEVIHLFERECSIQRRHQKVVEEAPSPALDDDLREAMTAAAVQAARSVSYRGAGTVELLLSDVSREFFFLEMNTRLQVEHPVTEAITGLDLVEWQLRIAAGEPLPRSQEEVTRSGHAIEVRLYAEDPAHEHLPQTGRLLAFDVPAGDDVRVDAGVVSGTEVSPHYDPMLAKLIARGDTRDDAITRLRWLLDRTVALGVTTNLEHLRDIVTTPAFAAGDLHTGFLDEHLPDWHRPPVVPELIVSAVAALLPTSPPVADPWTRLGPWRGAGVGGWHLRVRDDRGAEHEVTATGSRSGLRVTVDGSEHHAVRATDGAVTAVEAGGGAVWVHRAGVTARFEVVPATRHAAPGLAASGSAFSSPMPGTVAAVNVGVGDHVEANTLLVVVEAMKMEHPIRAPVAGTISAVHVAVGDAVDADQPLIALAPEGTDESSA